MNTTTSEGVRVFEATMHRAQALINGGIISAPAVCTGLLGVVTEVGAAMMGAAETARMLRLAADALDEMPLDS